MKTTKNLTMRLGFAVGLLTAMLVAQETGNPDKSRRTATPGRNGTTRKSPTSNPRLRPQKAQPKSSRQQPPARRVCG